VESLARPISFPSSFVSVAEKSAPFLSSLAMIVQYSSGLNA